MKAVSTPNIALIKYWGNRQNEWRLPAADSLSITLDGPSLTAEVLPSDEFSVQSFNAEGKRKIQSEKAVARLAEHYTLTKKYLATLTKQKILPEHVSLEIYSEIPQGIGIASSAAIFSCLAEAYAGMVAEKKKLSREEISVIARLGSGSAARSVFGGFAAFENTKGEGIDSAVGRAIKPAQHWPLHDIIIVPDQTEKKVGSTEGHAMAATSPLFEERVKQIPRRMKECIAAIKTKDFEKLQRVAEEDSMNMHECMRTQDPSLNYLSEETFHIIREIEALRKSDHLEVLYTMDAGPTVHLFCTDDAVKTINAFAGARKNCLVFRSTIGGGSRLC